MGRSLTINTCPLWVQTAMHCDALCSDALHCFTVNVLPSFATARFSSCSLYSDISIHISYFICMQQEREALKIKQLSQLQSQRYHQHQNQHKHHLNQMQMQTQTHLLQHLYWTMLQAEDLSRRKARARSPTMLQEEVERVCFRLEGNTSQVVVSHCTALYRTTLQYTALPGCMTTTHFMKTQNMHENTNYSTIRCKA
jgi:hypothetical protein